MRQRVSTLLAAGAMATAFWGTSTIGAHALPGAPRIVRSILRQVASNPVLRVLQRGPEGEIQELSEANEVRVVFSEPMVVLGRIPEPVAAPFFRIAPSVPGSFRWSGTDTLIFTPAARTKLASATRYEVTLDSSATSVAGRRFERPFTFAFTTPTVRLLRTEWHRKSGRPGSPVLVVLRFNQPVQPAAIAAHIQLALVPHDWPAPALPGAALARLKAADPRAAADFEAKVARTQMVVGSSSALPFVLASEADPRTLPLSNDTVVLETQGAPASDCWLRVAIDAHAPSAEGKQTPGKSQDYVIKLEPAFFVDGFHCEKQCNPERYNPLALRLPVLTSELRDNITVWDVTDPGHADRIEPAPKKRGADDEPLSTGRNPYDTDPDVLERPATHASLEELGFTLQPAHSYAVKLASKLTATDGQSLGYTWMGLVENWHRWAFASFESGHGVWEAGGGARVPFAARNFKSVTQWLAPVSLEALTPAVVRLQQSGFQSPPEATATERQLFVKPDQVLHHGLELGPHLKPNGLGLVWAAVRDGDAIPRAHHSPSPRPEASLIQVTNLGISVKDSPKNTLVLVTRLSDAAPVAGAKVTIRTLDNAVFWSGTTDPNGFALAPDTALRPVGETDWWYGLHNFVFVVTAEKDGDVAYLCSDWNQGMQPWNFGLRFDLREARPILRGSVFSDRGVYKLGEEVHLKAILRSDTASGMRQLETGSEAELVLRDSHGQERDRRSLALSEWGAADWALTLPQDGPLGRYEVTAQVAGQREQAAGSFLVAAYRRPDFRVDAELGGETGTAGESLKGVVAARYLFGAPMAGRPVRWTYMRTPLYTVPKAIVERFPEERFAFLADAARGDEEEPQRFQRQTQPLKESSEELDEAGRLELRLETELRAGAPYRYTLEGDVTDLSRQTIAGRASFTVHPAPWYVGLKRPPYFVEMARGLDTEIVAAAISGEPVKDVAVHVSLTQVQWHSVRRAEGQGHYGWWTEQKEIAAGEWDVTTGAQPVPLHVVLESGGCFTLRATARDAEGRHTTTVLSFYVLGPGYTAWARYDHNRIDLVPERKTYKPGETARILVKSPWEAATAVLTTEREGVRTQRPFALTSTQQTVDVELSEDDIPNLYVSVLLVKGRSSEYTDEDASDPGKPSYRIGYVELKVEDARKRLGVTIASDREEYKPAAKASVRVDVRDPRGQPGRAEVTLWAVDYGVLSLTAYKTPDVLASVWVPKALQVLNEDSRQRIISRRVTVTKGGDEGGGGGADDGPGTPVRQDFRVLAFWLGSLVTDEKGQASSEVTLPESLTTYRIMAVAGDKASRFGWAEREIRTSKPVLLKPAFPRFLALGDEAYFGSVVHSQLPQAGRATVTLRSLAPQVLEVLDEAPQQLEIAAKGSAEVRFHFRAESPGDARIRMTVSLLGESDAFEQALPVRILSSPEVVAAYGQARPEAREVVELPKGVVPDLGGLRVELASTSLVGLGEGARYLVEYPYGCAEQRSSRALALLLAADLGEAFHLPGIEPSELRSVVQQTFKELEEFQCPGGGFSYWKGECRWTSPYLTSYVLHVHQRGAKLGYAVAPSVLARGYDYLQARLNEPPPINEGWWPAYTAWQAFAAKVLVEGGLRQDSVVTRLYSYLDRMPVFALAYLHDAMLARGEAGDRPLNLRRRMRNAILPEGGSAHVEELNDPYLLWFWNSNVRSTALVTGSLLADPADEPLVTRLTRWLVKVRKNGRWGNTQENAMAMEALVDYYRKYEAEVPDFTGVVTLGSQELLKESFRGRSAEARVGEVGMAKLLTRGAAGQRLDLSFNKEGKGTLFYAARLKYAASDLTLQGIDQGIRVERSYAPLQDGAAPATSYRAGELVRVTLAFELTKERRFVAVTDPLPAGFEPVESWFATTAVELARDQSSAESQDGDWTAWWRRGGFDHVERHDDRVLLFATRLDKGRHVFSYVARATTAGSFRTAPTHAEEMYEPEVFGRTATHVIEVKP